MKTLDQEIEDMRLRMNDWAKNELNLVTTFYDALKDADNRLLDDVRNLTSEHDARRAALMKELQGLASRLGALSPLRDPFAPINGAAALSAVEPPNPSPGQLTSRHADRRAPNPSLAEGLARHLPGRATGH